MQFHEGQTMDVDDGDGVIKITEVTPGSVTARVSADAAVIDWMTPEGSSGTYSIGGHDFYYEIITDSKALKEMEIRMSRQDFEALLREEEGIDF